MRQRTLLPRSLPRRVLIAIVTVAVTTLNHSFQYAAGDDSVTTGAASIPDPDDLRALAIAETLRPVRPGEPEKVPFWNQYAQRFIHAPAFDFQPQAGAQKYKFTVTAKSSGENFSFESDEPWDDLGPIWKDLPVGSVELKVEAIKNGEVIGTSSQREFYKAAPYQGPYHASSTDYRDSVEKLLRYLFEQPYIQHWLTTGKPDPAYGLYCYPSKMYPAVIGGMLMFAEVTDDAQEKQDALKIARNAADRLINLSQAEGKPLEFFPPTYTGRIYADIHGEWRGEDLSDRIMMVYPAGAAQAFLDLFNRTQEEKYLDAAIRIANTYKKTQRENGTWSLLLYIADGQPVAKNFVVPTRLVAFLDRLKSEYGVSGYEDCSRRALTFIQEDVAKDFNWEGQFEDQKPAERFKNLSKSQAIAYAMLLLGSVDDNPDDLAQAEEIIRFAEDQFVIWERPNPQFGNKEKNSANWQLPCALEQYNFYVPVNSSTATMIEAFRMAYEKTGNELYLAKSIDLANSIVNAQNEETGHYPTYMIRTLLWTEGWINCMVGTARTMDQLDDYLKKIEPIEQLVQTRAGIELDEATPSDAPKGTIAFSSVAVRHWDLYSHSAGGDESAVTQDRALDFNAAFSPDDQRIAFVSERHGNMELYVSGVDGSGLRRLTNNFALDDHPTWSPDGKRLAFVSTREPSTVVGQAWNAIYVMNADGTGVRKISQSAAADYSPAWSPRGDLIAFASGSGQSGKSDIYVMDTDGRGRRLVVKNGGWPTFIESGEAIAFHSRREGKRWDIWRVNLDGSKLERLAENASMPHATADGRKLAAVVQSDRHKQIGVFDIDTGEIETITEAGADHWNPTISSDGMRVIYHKVTTDATTPNVQLWGRPPNTGLNLLRVAGGFPAFSPNEDRLALTGGGFSQIDVMNVDGSNRKTIFKGKNRSLFGMSWSEPPERVAFSHGVVFAKADFHVNIIAASPDSKESDTLTGETGNNGFPCYSPDGKQIIFRSGRSGAKNLYIMDRSGENVRRLTDGKWTDTMPDWSPTGEWIAFSSDRGDDFEIWLIRSDGSGLRKLIGGGGRSNHPHFSPDGKWIVFTSQRAGYSAEEVSMPSQPQPYGSLFVVRTDGTGLLRLTHNGTEEGTPAWGSATALEPSDEGGTTKGEY